MNATGEGDLTNYYDDIRSYQTSSLSLSLRFVDEVLVRSAIGRFPDSFDYEWNPLRQQDETQIAAAQKTRAERDAIYLEANVITRSQIQRNLQTSETYQFDDENIDQLEALEEPNLFDLPPVGQNETVEETESFADSWAKQNP